MPRTSKKIAQPFYRRSYRILTINFPFWLLAFMTIVAGVAVWDTTYATAMLILFGLGGGLVFYCIYSGKTAEDQRKVFPVEEMDAMVLEYSRKGYLVANRSATQVQLIRKKSFSFFIAALGLLTAGILTVIYILYFLAKRDEIITLTFSRNVSKG